MPAVVLGAAPRRPENRSQKNRCKTPNHQRRHSVLLAEPSRFVPPSIPDLSSLSRCPIGKEPTQTSWSRNCQPGVILLPFSTPMCLNGHLRLRRVTPVTCRFPHLNRASPAPKPCSPSCRFSGGVCAVKKLFVNFLRDQSGQDKVEFALIAALLALVLIGSEQKLGNKIDKDYKTIGNTITNLDKKN